MGKVRTQTIVEEVVLTGYSYEGFAIALHASVPAGKLRIDSTMKPLLDEAAEAGLTPHQPSKRKIVDQAKA